MSRQPWLVGVLGLALAVTLVLVGAALRQGAGASPAPPAPVAVSYWSYTAKYVCGLQRDAGADQQGEPPVKPGNYATEINIHNPNYKIGLANALTINKKVVALVRDGQAIGREPETAGPTH